MSVITSSIPASVTKPAQDLPQRSSWSLVGKSGRVIVGGGVLLIILLLCLATLPWTLRSDSSLYYAAQTGDARGAPVAKSGGWFKDRKCTCSREFSERCFRFCRSTRACRCRSQRQSHFQRWKRCRMVFRSNRSSGNCAARKRLQAITGRFAGVQHRVAKRVPETRRRSP